MDLQELAAQLRKPEGTTGIQVAEMMNKGNLLLNQWCIQALDIKPGDTVLEIGMGNGYFAKDILAVHPSVSYTGLDYSPLMTEAALSLNQQFIKDGRAAFQTGQASSMPFPANYFSAIITVNTIYFWDDAEKELNEIKRVMKEHGRLVIGIRNKKAMEKMPFTEYGFRKYDKEGIIRLAESNGFRVFNAEEKKEPPYVFNGEIIEMENIVLICGN